VRSRVALRGSGPEQLAPVGNTHGRASPRTTFVRPCLARWRHAQKGLEVHQPPGLDGKPITVLRPIVRLTRWRLMGILDGGNVDEPYGPHQRPISMARRGYPVPLTIGRRPMMGRRLAVLRGRPLPHLCLHSSNGGRNFSWGGPSRSANDSRDVGGLFPAGPAPVGLARRHIEQGVSLIGYRRSHLMSIFGPI